MDGSIIILVSMLTTAMGLWLVIVSKEKVQAIKQYNSKEIVRLARAERIRRLIDTL